MRQVTQITNNLFLVGASDRRLALFENVFPIPGGVSYNSYLSLDDKTVLLDTVDRSVAPIFFENIEYVLNGRPLDYVIVNHMEPDHAATLGELVLRYPNVTIVGNAKTFTLIDQFFELGAVKRLVVAEGDVLETGRRRFTFVCAPMVHWIEVMVTYEITERILFSADAFGTFGALSGHVFADELHFERDYLSDARRYYTNIVGKYGSQVHALLKKAATLDIAIVAPLHGPIWRSPTGIAWFIDKYKKWATYTPEETGVLIAYGSVYGGTENAASVLAGELAALGNFPIALYDVSVTHPSYILSEAFRFSHIVFASATYNAGVFMNMQTLVDDIVAHNLQNRTVAVIENGSWAPTAGGLIVRALADCKNMTVLDNRVTIRSTVKEDDRVSLSELAADIAASMPKKSGDSKPLDNEKIDNTAFYKLSYGMYAVTSESLGARSGFIADALMQITDSPKRVAIAVNKSNFTHSLISKSGIFNVSVLDVDAPFEIYRRFGFQSGRDADKFDGAKCAVSSNGLPYLAEYANAMLSCRVISRHEHETHTLFIADVTESVALSDKQSATYEYYQKNIKPRPEPPQENDGVERWICKTCGYVHEGPLPSDYICPLCKKGAEEFEKM